MVQTIDDHLTTNVQPDDHLVFAKNSVEIRFMASTKVISVRIPWELYEEILKESATAHLSVSEFLLLHLTLVYDQHENISDIIHDILACSQPCCGLREKFNQFFNDQVDDPE